MNVTKPANGPTSQATTSSASSSLSRGQKCALALAVTVCVLGIIGMAYGFTHGNTNISITDLSSDQIKYLGAAAIAASALSLIPILYKGSKNIDQQKMMESVARAQEGLERIEAQSTETSRPQSPDSDSEAGPLVRTFSIRSFKLIQDSLLEPFMRPDSRYDDDYAIASMDSDSDILLEASPRSSPDRLDERIAQFADSRSEKQQALFGPEPLQIQATALHMQSLEALLESHIDVNALVSDMDLTDLVQVTQTESEVVISGTLSEMRPSSSKQTQASEETVATPTSVPRDTKASPIKKEMVKGIIIASVIALGILAMLYGPGDCYTVGAFAALGGGVALLNKTFSLISRCCGDDDEEIVNDNQSINDEFSGYQHQKITGDDGLTSFLPPDDEAALSTVYPGPFRPSTTPTQPKPILRTIKVVREKADARTVTFVPEAPDVEKDTRNMREAREKIKETGERPSFVRFA